MDPLFWNIVVYTIMDMQLRSQLIMCTAPFSYYDVEDTRVTEAAGTYNCEWVLDEGKRHSRASAYGDKRLVELVGEKFKSELFSVGYNEYTGPENYDPEYDRRISAYTMRQLLLFWIGLELNRMGYADDVRHVAHIVTTLFTEKDMNDFVTFCNAYHVFDTLSDSRWLYIKNYSMDVLVESAYDEFKRSAGLESVPSNNAYVVASVKAYKLEPLEWREHWVGDRDKTCQVRNAVFVCKWAVEAAKEHRRAFC